VGVGVGVGVGVCARCAPVAMLRCRGGRRMLELPLEPRAAS